LKRSLNFIYGAWVEYKDLERVDKKLVKKLDRMLLELLRSDNPGQGTGKPEKLKNRVEWSRRIDKGNRVLYLWDESSIYVIQIGGHYGDH